MPRASPGPSATRPMSDDQPENCDGSRSQGRKGARLERFGHYVLFSPEISPREARGVPLLGYHCIAHKTLQEGFLSTTGSMMQRMCILTITSDEISAGNPRKQPMHHLSPSNERPSLHSPLGKVLQRSARGAAAPIPRTLKRRTDYHRVRVLAAFPITGPLLSCVFFAEILKAIITGGGWVVLLRLCQQ